MSEDDWDGGPAAAKELSFRLSRREKKPYAKGQDEHLSPEERLWRMVVLIALQDLQSYRSRLGRSLNGRRSRLSLLVEQTVNEIESKHFALVCELAGISHSRCLSVVRRILQGESVVPLVRRRSQELGEQVLNTPLRRYLF